MSRVVRIFFPETGRQWAINVSVLAVLLILGFFLSFIWSVLFLLLSFSIVQVLRIKGRIGTESSLRRSFSDLYLYPMMSPVVFLILFNVLLEGTALKSYILIMYISALLLASGFLLNRLSYSLDRKAFPSHAIFFGGISRKITILGIATLLLLYYYTVYISIPLIFYSVAASISDSRFILRDSSRNLLKGISYYFKESLDRWLTYWVAVGIFFDVIVYPKPALYNVYIITVFVAVLVLMVIRAVYKSYKVSYLLLEEKKDTLFSKHNFVPRVATDETVGFVINNTREFVIEGKSENILVSLSYLMTLYGIGYQRIVSILDPIIHYRKPEIIYTSASFAEKTINDEKENRSMIIRKVIETMAGENVGH
ncbi:MAG: hypothetical protein ACP5NK_02065 [Thermoplasmata archaeon]